MEILMLYILDFELLLDISLNNSTACLPLGYWLLHISLQGCNYEFFIGLDFTGWANKIMCKYQNFCVSNKVLICKSCSELSNFITETHNLMYIFSTVLF